MYHINSLDLDNLILKQSFLKDVFHPCCNRKINTKFIVDNIREL